MKNFYCYNCNNFFEAEVATACPHCHAVGDDIEEAEDEDEKYIDYSDESGFDPYMGCYTGDC